MSQRQIIFGQSLRRSFDNASANLFGRLQLSTRLPNFNQMVQSSCGFQIIAANTFPSEQKNFFQIIKKLGKMCSVIKFFNQKVHRSELMGIQLNTWIVANDEQFEQMVIDRRI